MEFLRGSPSIQDRARVRLCLVGGGTYVDDSSDSSDEADGGSSLSLYRRYCGCPECVQRSELQRDVYGKRQGRPN